MRIGFLAPPADAGRFDLTFSETSTHVDNI